MLRKMNFIEDPLKSVKYSQTFDAMLQEKISYFPNIKQEIIIEEGLKGISGRVVFTTNNYGFRGDPLIMPKPTSEFRIFMVGASNVECRLLNDDVTITAILQKQLQSQQETRTIKVYNAGKSSNSTSDLLALITHRLIHLQPDMLIIFPTSGEFTAYLRKINQQTVLNIMETKQIIKMLLTEFQIGRYLYNAAVNIRNKTNMFPGAHTEFLAKAAQRAKTPVSDPQMNFDFDEYERKVVSIIGIAKVFNIPLVFMTQPTTLLSQDPLAYQMHWGLLVDGINYREETLQKNWDKYNAVSLEIAHKYGVPTLDLANLLPGTFDYFYDVLHFNLAGAKKSAELLADYIFREGLIPMD